MTIKNAHIGYNEGSVLNVNADFSAINSSRVDFFDVVFENNTVPYIYSSAIVYVSGTFGMLFGQTFYLFTQL